MRSWSNSCLRPRSIKRKNEKGSRNKELLGVWFSGAGFGKLSFFGDCLSLGLEHVILVATIAALETLHVPAIRIRIDEKVPRAFRAALESPHHDNHLHTLLLLTVSVH